jgi:diacylglycerol kinase family enzyme
LPANGTLFLNRSSGAKLPEDEITAFSAAASAAGLEVLEIAPGLDIAATIREHRARGVKLFVAAGGDGTIHHVLQGVVNTDAHLAVIPIGTYNHFARDLGIPLDWREALEVACSGTVRQIDAARINDRFFVNNVSIGLYPELVARREERGRDYPRWKARLYAFYWTARKYPHVTLAMEADERHETIRTHLFMVSNNSYDLSQIGIEAARSTLTAGRLSVYWMPHVARWQLTKLAARYLAGRVRSTPGFQSFRTLRLHVQSSRVRLKVGVDGELFDLATPLRITIVPQSLLVRVPQDEAAAQD